MGMAMSHTGVMFPLFGTLIGWLGVALSGTDAGSNALFGSFQTITAQQLGLSPILMGAANSAGGVMGKMIAAQSLVIGCAATGQQGPGRIALPRGAQTQPRAGAAGGTHRAAVCVCVPRRDSQRTSLLVASLKHARGARDAMGEPLPTVAAQSATFRAVTVGSGFSEHVTTSSTQTPPRHCFQAPIWWWRDAAPRPVKKSETLFGIRCSNDHGIRDRKARCFMKSLYSLAIMALLAAPAGFGQRGTDRAAARFLDQATWGPTPASIAQLKKWGSPTG